MEARHLNNKPGGAVTKPVQERNHQKISTGNKTYNLAWFSLWWMRMEREGMMEREVLRMQKAMRKNIIVHHQDCTPCDKWTTPQKWGRGPTCVSENDPIPESPAKRRKTKFTSLLSF